jgi:fumarate hydratase class II
VIGNDTAITIGGMQGNFELNVRVPLIARNLLQSIELLTNASNTFADRCVSGITANEDRLRWTAEHTLASATALNPAIGYDAATEVVRLADRTGVSLRAAGQQLGIDDDVLAKALDPDAIAHPHVDVKRDEP